MKSARDEVEGLLDQIRSRVADPVVERASEQISVLCRGYMAPDPLALIPASIKSHLTAMELSLLCLFMDREGKTLRRESIMDAMYGAKPGQEPDIKVVDVFVCKLRKKLRESGYRIDTIWGFGYRLVKGEQEDRRPYSNLKVVDRQSAAA